MEGIKETKEALIFVLELGKALEKGLSDGKLDLADALAFLPAMTKAPGAFSDSAKIPAELKDLSEAERVELTTYLKDEFDLSDDNLESKIELGLEVALHLAKLVASLRV
jgi:hypothetical protein